MSDIYAAQLGAAINKGAAQVGHVGFSRQDGPASIQINSALSAEAGVKLEAFLRDLIAEDAPVMDALMKKAQQESEAQQRAAMQRFNSGGNANAPKQGYRDFVG